MAGRGRGRGLTLPAWMTSGAAEGAAAPTPSIALSTSEGESESNTNTTTNVVPSSSSSSSFSSSSNYSNNLEQSNQMNKAAANQFLQSESAPISRAPLADTAAPPKPRASGSGHRRTVHIGSAPSSAPVPSQQQQQQQYQQYQQQPQQPPPYQQQYQQPQQQQSQQQQQQPQYPPPAFPPPVFTPPGQPTHALTFPHQPPQPQAQAQGQTQPQGNGFSPHMYQQQQPPPQPQPHAQQQPPPHLSQQQQQPRGPPFLPPPAGVGGPGPMMMGAVGGVPGGMMPRAMPRGFPPPTVPPPAVQTLNDPLNDVKSWSEHVAAADKRVYWHNKITKTSTYEKPACLQCPEERSIPPCRWKEYAKDGKLYYSTGKGEASWTMPEEFREWRARVDGAVERFQARKTAAAAALLPPAQSTAAPSSSSSSSSPRGGAGEEGMSNGAGGVALGGFEQATQQQMQQPTQGADHNGTVANVTTVTPAADVAPVAKVVVEKVPEVVVTYASEKEAVQAFKQLLTDHEVSAVMKFKDVQELCSHEVRWTACKSVGARKQALSEFQTQKMKSEREEKRLQTRKKRDLFFQLLAETTAIDGRTRWRDAQELLQDSRRYKQIEDDREREDYFTEFVVELAKKEKEDLLELKKIVKVNYVAILDDLFAAGKVKRNAIWADVKDDILSRLDSSLNTLEDADKRHMFQDYMMALESKLRQEEKAAEEEFKSQLKVFQADFCAHLHTLVASGVLSAQVKWREVKPRLIEQPSFVSLLQFVEDNDLKRASDKDKKDKSKDKDATTSSSSMEGGPRDVFDEVLASLVQAEREDRRLLRRVFEDGLEVNSRKHKGRHNKDTDDEENEEGEKEDDVSGVIVTEVKHDSSMLETKMQLENFVANAAITEDTHKIFKYKAPIAEILTHRFQNFENIFNAFVAEKIEELAAKAKKQKKYEDRYLDLLDDFYYRSDHVGLQWDEAKKDLSRHSAYLDLSRDLRKSLFLTHMQELAAELAKKSSSSSSSDNKDGSDGNKHGSDQEEGEIDVDSASEETATVTAASGRKGSVSPHHSPSQSRSRSRSASPDKRRSSKKREHGDEDRDGDRDRDGGVKHSSSKHRHSGGDKDKDRDRGSSKRKRHHDSNKSEDESDDDDRDDDDSGREREHKSKRSKKDKKDKKSSHKHSSHKHKSHRDRSHDRRS